MSNPIFKSGGKFYVEELVNGKLTLREVDPTTIANPVPPSSVAVNIDNKINEAVKKVIDEIDERIIDDRIAERVAPVAVNIDNKINEAVKKVIDEIDERIIDDRIAERVAPLVAEFRQPLEICELHDAGTFEYEAEKFRWLGQSGLVGTRQYNYGGSKPYHRPFDVAYLPMNIHTHADYYSLMGMGELVLSMNGYYLRTRHNDYCDYKPHSTSKNYEATERIARPTLPSNVTGTVDQQRSIMQVLYTRLYNTMQNNSGTKLTASEKSSFRWDMAYAECWWEILTDGTVGDPGNNTRHTNASNDVRTMLREAQYYNYGGHKNRYENTGYWVAAVKEVNVDGTPAFAVLKFRILMYPMGTMADYLPSDLFDHVKDYKSLMRFNMGSWDALKNSQFGRFKIKENRDSYGLLDRLINKIPGLDNEPGVITEQYTQYGETETIYNMSNSAVNNAARYFRFSYILADASGRDVERRGFNDPYLFVAMNTQAKVKKYNINGRDYRFSYMIPLEMVLRHPLEVWNPYQIPEATAASQVTGAGTASNPFTKVWQDLHWYLTPGSFFDARIDSDAADTVKTGRFYKGADGNAYNTAASGTYIFLPQIRSSNGSVLVPGNGIRVRWPVYPCFHEGSHAHAEMEAFRDYLLASNVTDNPFFNGGSF